MKLNRKLISVCVATMLVTSTAPVIWAKDYETHWAKTTIDKWKDKDIISGFEDGTFRPDEAITKAQFAKILVKLFGYNSVDNAKTYTDVEADQWYSDYITKLSVAGISHETDNSYHPNEPITREEAAYALCNAYKLESTNHLNKVFNDNDLISSWAKNEVNTLYNEGYITGDKQGNFNPKNSLTRAEFITIIDRINAEVLSKKGTYTQNINGNLVINTPGVTLKNMIISGNLYLAEGIGEGDVTLENVEVDGHVYVEGGGVNSIYSKNSICKGKVKVLAKNPVRIVSENKPINVEILNIAEVILVGQFNEVVVIANSNLTIQDKSNIETLIVKSGNGNPTNIMLAQDSNINKLEVNHAANITNIGIIKELKVNTNNVTTTEEPEKVTLADNVTAIIAGQKQAGKTTSRSGSSSSSSGSSSSSSSTSSSSGGSSGSSSSSSSGSSSGSNSGSSSSENTDTNTGNDKEDNKDDNKDDNKEDDKDDNKDDNKEDNKDDNKDDNKGDDKDDNKDDNKEDNKDDNKGEQNTPSNGEVKETYAMSGIVYKQNKDGSREVAKNATISTMKYVKERDYWIADQKAQTDDNGFYSMNLSTSTKYNLFVEIENEDGSVYYYSERQTEPRKQDQNNHDLIAEYTRVAYLTVVDQDRRPIESIYVDEIENGKGHGYGHMPTDSKGKVRFLLSSNDNSIVNYKFYMNNSKGTNEIVPIEALSDIRVGDVQNKVDIEVKLPLSMKLSTIEGQVVIEEGLGESLANKTIRLEKYKVEEKDGYTNFTSIGQYIQTTTDSNGNFKFENVTPLEDNEIYRLNIYSLNSNYSGNSITLYQFQGNGNKILLKQQCELTVYVVDEDRNPMDNVTIELATPHTHRSRSTYSNGEAQISFISDDEDTYTLKFYINDKEIQPKSISEPLTIKQIKEQKYKASCYITLPRHVESAVTGTLLSEDNTPISGLEVQLKVKSGYQYTPYKVTTTDSAGVFKFEDIDKEILKEEWEKSAQFMLVIDGRDDKGNRYRKDMTLYELQENEGKMNLEQKYSLIIKVVAEDGVTPVENVYVELKDENDNRLSYKDELTNNEGILDIRNIYNPAKYTLKVEHNGKIADQEFEIIEGQYNNEVTLVLQPNAPTKMKMMKQQAVRTTSGVIDIMPEEDITEE